MYVHLHVYTHYVYTLHMYTCVHIMPTQVYMCNINSCQAKRMGLNSCQCLHWAYRMSIEKQLHPLLAC